MPLFTPPCLLAAAFLLVSIVQSAGAAAEVQWTPSASTVETYDFLEVEMRLDESPDVNPFTGSRVSGWLSREGDDPVHVDGFCDSEDGRVFRIRFMPTQTGRHEYGIRLEHPGGEERFDGAFMAVDSGRRGLLRVDPGRPNHFVWEGTGEHYFWNGTTTYYLMGWEDDTVIEGIVDRLRNHRINRLRVLVYGRNKDRPWGQPVKTTDAFKLYLNPWPAERPADIENPGFDLTRFNTAYWRKYERLLRYARERDVVVSVIFFIGGQVYPTPFEARGEDEIRFYRYGVARFAAFSNVTWDLGNEHNFHREVPEWCDWLGPKVKEWDPYDHILSAHNVVYRSKDADWNDIQLIQRWDAGQNAYMLGERKKQADTGRVVPNINEEYGYEDLWEKYEGQRAVDTRRRLAWEISMAGCYQTTGETAERGTGFPPDTGGGWVNGRGDDSMTMLDGYKHMADFFTSVDWWNFDPMNEWVSGGAMCLAKPGEAHILYLPKPAFVTVSLGPGNHYARWYNPREGTWHGIPAANGPLWTAPLPPDGGDWALLLQRDDGLTDTVPPVPRIAECLVGGSRLRVRFSELVDPDTAADPANYRLEHGGRVTGAKLAPEGNAAVLDIEPLPNPGDYTLFVGGIGDRASAPNIPHKEVRLPFEYVDVFQPIVSLDFGEGEGTRIRNLGSSADEAEAAVIAGDGPRWTAANAPVGGEYALDFGVEPNTGAVDLGRNPIESLRGLKSFTIAGWVNARSNVTGSGGNRIASSIDNGGDGFDLVCLADGALQLGVNQWPDGSPAKSAPGAISFDPEAGSDNWRFFAVTYDSTLEEGHVKFYTGGPDDDARPAGAADYDRGETGGLTGVMSIGHFNPGIRSDAKDRMFRGIIGGIRLYGSHTDGSGAFDLDPIVNIQKGLPAGGGR